MILFVFMMCFHYFIDMVIVEGIGTVVEQVYDL